MRILSVQPAARRGGPSIQHLNFARESIAQGVEHHVIIREDHEMLMDFREVFSSVTTFSPVNAIIPRTLSPHRLFAYKRLVRRLSGEFAAVAADIGADLLWTVNDAFLPGPLGARKAGIPALTHFLGMTSYTPKPVGLALMTFHRRYSQGIVTCQDLIARDLAALGYPAEQIGVVYNGIDIARFATTEHRLNAGSAPVTIGMVANLDRRKGLSLFVEAAARVRDAAPDTRFRIVGDLEGDPAYLAEIRTLVEARALQDCLHLDGIVSDMPAWFAGLDIGCVPSLIEALSVACLEGMASGLPIVATDVGGNFIAVKHEETGLLSKPADPEDLARQLLRLVDSPDTRHTFGKAGHALVAKTFSLPTVVGVLNERFHHYTGSLES